MPAIADEKAAHSVQEFFDVCIPGRAGGSLKHTRFISFSHNNKGPAVFFGQPSRDQPDDARESIGEVNDVDCLYIPAFQDLLRHFHSLVAHGLAPVVNDAHLGYQHGAFRGIIGQKEVRCHPGAFSEHTPRRVQDRVYPIVRSLSRECLR